MTRPSPRQERPRLSSEAIVRAALEISEAEGLDKVSIHKVGAALGVAGMSLYNHIPDKAALIDGIGDAILREVELPVLDDVEWDDGLRAIADAFRVTLARYPQTAAFVLTRRLNAPAALPFIDATLGLLRGAGFRDHEAVHFMRLLIAFLIGSLVREAGISSSTTTDSVPIDITWGPNLVATAPILRGIDHNAEFHFGLSTLLTAFRSQLLSTAPTDAESRTEEHRA